MKNIPNILSFCRILMIPFIIVQFLNGNQMNVAILLIISGVTDLLDGYLARKYDWISSLGKFLDPAADKLTLITMSILIVFSLKEYRIIFIILLVKDAIMFISGGVLLKKGIKIEGAKYIGKIATLSFYTSMVVMFLFPSINKSIITGMLIVVLTLEIISFISYIPEFKKYAKVFFKPAKQKLKYK